MIDEAKAKLVIAEVAEVCRKHGVYLVGASYSENQNAEIVISDEVEDNMDGKLNELISWIDEPSVSAIG